MAYKLIIIFLLLLHNKSLHSTAQTWVKSGYWLTVNEFPVTEIDSSLFTHLFCAFASLNSSTFHLSIPSRDEDYFSSFTTTVKLKNPSVLTLLSIGDSRIAPLFFSMLSNSSFRKSFIDSSVRTARRYGFDGIDLCCLDQRNTSSNMKDMGTLFEEWRAAVDSEARINSGMRKLILTIALYYLPENFPVNSIQRSFDWVHIIAFDYYVSLRDKFVHPHAALYDPFSNVSTDYGIREWINKGLSVGKMVLGLPYHGYAWTLMNPKNKMIGAPSSGPAITPDGSMSYNFIKEYVHSYGAVILYNSTYVENYCTIGSFWIGFDDVEAIKTKVSYVKEKGLLGYTVFQVGNDDNWVLSKAAADSIDGKNQPNKSLLLAKIIVPVALVALLLGLTLYFFRRRLHNYMTDASAFRSDSPDLEVFSFADIRAATNDFAPENMLGEGGFGPVYKGKLQNGQEIAVKRLSKTSKQGFEELKTEVTLTVRLQHVNLVKIMGFCIEKGEKMLVYEYLRNKSLDFYIFDNTRQFLLDWEKRVYIIEGIIQGLLYLQEYSRFTIIHRDLKASNILLDDELRPKISDFGLARMFHKSEHEANTDRIVGTYGYVPPEYVKQGLYSTKYDVYSFGVLLLQIISGKRNNCLYGINENLNLLEYAYELWKDDRGMEFIDPALDDSSSRFKLMRCLQIALLCVQEKQEDRPSMLQVSTMLTNETEPMMIPKRPAFSMKTDEDASFKLNMSSINDPVISEIEPR